MRILLAEDDIKLAQHIRRGLTEASYAVDVAHDGDEAIWLSPRGVGRLCQTVFVDHNLSQRRRRVEIELTVRNFSHDR